MKYSFVIGGAPRSGTEWLLSSLREHPQIFIPTEEIRFFSYNFNESLEWYHKTLKKWKRQAVWGKKPIVYTPRKIR